MSYVSRPLWLDEPLSVVIRILNSHHCSISHSPVSTRSRRSQRHAHFSPKHEASSFFCRSLPTRRRFHWVDISSGLLSWDMTTRSYSNLTKLVGNSSLWCTLPLYPKLLPSSLLRRAGKLEPSFPWHDTKCDSFCDRWKLRRKLEVD